MPGSVAWFCYKLPFFLFANTLEPSVTIKKAKCACFIIYMQQQKVWFTSVQINMKQISYMGF